MSDDVVWDCIRHGHCSFMAKIETGIFCRNPYNATGICNRSSCPLANSRYATIRDHDGVFYLYMKSAERAHLPKKLWERVKLELRKSNRSYRQASSEFWPKLLVHKIKQRLTKMTQYRIRMRRLQLKVREKIVTVPRKKTQRYIKREDYALTAAQIDNCVQSELLERLNKGLYGEIYNYDEDKFITILATIGNIEEEGKDEYVIADDMEREVDDLEDFEGLLNNRLGDTYEFHDLEKQKWSSSNSRSMIGKRSRKVITELEQEEDTHNRRRTLI